MSEITSLSCTCCGANLPSPNRHGHTQCEYCQTRHRVNRRGDIFPVWDLDNYSLGEISSDEREIQRLDKEIFRLKLTLNNIQKVRRDFYRIAIIAFLILVLYSIIARENIQIIPLLWITYITMFIFSYIYVNSQLIDTTKMHVIRRKIAEKERRIRQIIDMSENYLYFRNR